MLNNLTLAEDNTTEFKLCFQKEVIETVVAFSNSKDGHIYIGVADDERALGVDISQESIQNYINIIKQATEPKIIVDIDIITEDGKDILDIQVDEYPIKPVSYKGRYFKRRKNSNHQMTPIEISNTHLKTINSSWDYFEDVNHTIEDIDEKNIEYFIKLTHLDNSLENVYKKFELLKNGTYKSMPKNLQIADIFKTANIIEKYGSGVKRVIKLFKEYGSKEPLFEDRLGGMVVVAYKKEHFQETPLKTRDKIVELIKNDKFITIKNMTIELEISRDTINKHLSRLKKDGIIKRVGSARSGYWEILSDDK